MEFGTDIWFPYWQQLATILIGVGGGAVLVPVYNWLKGLLGLRGGTATAGALVFAGLIALAELTIAGSITPDSFVLENIAELFIAVWVASQKVYDQWFKEK